MDLHSSPPVARPFAEYRAPGFGYDEYQEPGGEARQAWRNIAGHLDNMGVQGLQACEARSSHLVDESGAMFLAPGDDSFDGRPWRLATIPMVLDGASWANLEAGLQQRGRLLEAVLTDLLGEQRLLKERVIPPALLSANPNDWRVYHDLPNRGQKRLQLLATDLSRDPDGRWRVTGDRTRAPSGLGYLLENRIIISSVFPRLIRQNHVARLAPFFASLKRLMNSLAPRMRDNPRIAVLTPGKASYRYFEDAYLARYLGYTLVQGRDLAVRGERLNLKTLGGLLPIEVLWRHISDESCDPLELNPDSVQGVTGLLRAVRQGSVAVTNALGSSLMQIPALLPFLHEASRFLFAEELQLGSVVTYWCGLPGHRQYVLDHLDELMLRPAFVVTGSPPIVPSELSQAARAELMGAVNAAPHEYIAQVRPARSTTPVWHEGQMQPWHTALRSFQLQTESGIEVLPGGLGRVSPVAEPLDQSPTTGRLGLDCWVVGGVTTGTETTLLPPPNTPLRLTRSGSTLPSRVAENLFWLGRYVERTEAITRLLRTSLVRLAGETDEEELPEMRRLVAALAAVGQIEPDNAIEELGGSSPPLESVLLLSVFDRSQPRGLWSSMNRMLDNAGEVRDRISLDAYRIITRTCEDFFGAQESGKADLLGTVDRLHRLITDLLAFAGLASESITRTHGWRFLDLGRRIERAHQTAELLSATLIWPIEEEPPLLDAMLRITDSLMTYRSRYLAQLQPAAVIDLLITDELNPRSIAYQMQKIDFLLRQLPNETEEVGLGNDQRLAEQLSYRVRMSEPHALARHTDRGPRSGLGELLEPLIQDLPKLSDAIAARYLIHTADSQTPSGDWGKGDDSAEG